MLALLWSFMREAGVHEWNIMLNQIIHMNWLTQKKKSEKLIRIRLIWSSRSAWLNDPLPAHWSEVNNNSKFTKLWFEFKNLEHGAHSWYFYGDANCNCTEKKMLHWRNVIQVWNDMMVSKWYYSFKLKVVYMVLTVHSGSFGCVREECGSAP